jgi:hypothetical protein
VCQNPSFKRCLYYGKPSKNRGIWPAAIFLLTKYIISKKERLDAAYNYLDQIKSVAGELQSAQPDVEARADRFQFLCFQFGLRFFKDLMRNVEKIIGELQKDE